MRSNFANDDDDDQAEEYYAFEETTDEEQAETVPCPYCRCAVHEDAVRCPHCERYISAEDRPPQPKPWWLIIGVAASLYAVYKWITAPPG